MSSVSPLWMVFLSIEVRLFPPPRGMASKLKRPRSLFFRLGKVTGGQALESPAGRRRPPVANLNSRPLSKTQPPSANTCLTCVWDVTFLFVAKSSRRTLPEFVELHSKHKANTWGQVAPLHPPLPCYICMSAWCSFTWQQRWLCCSRVETVFMLLPLNVCSIKTSAK